MMRRFTGPSLCAALLVAACTQSPPAAPQSVDEPPQPQAKAPAQDTKSKWDSVLSPQKRKQLAAWFELIGSPKSKESFGDLIARIARSQLGKPYGTPEQRKGPEELKVKFDSFECVSLVESSLALGTCIWQQTPTSDCFLKQVEDVRYRNGERTDYASRLHYFSDWLAENDRRKRVVLLTRDLGGKAIREPFDYMTKRPKKYPALEEEDAVASMEEVEQRLSQTQHFVLENPLLRKAQRKLKTGDIVAFVTKRKGLMVGHVGLVDRSGKDGTPRLLHASNHHKRVLITQSGIARYVARRPERRGIMVARPQPPPIEPMQARNDTN